VEETPKILARINPWLLEELDDLLDEADDTDYENLSYDDTTEGDPSAGNPSPAEPVDTPAGSSEPQPHRD